MSLLKDETADDRVTRVMLWCPPRSGSTAFLKCLTSVPNLQAWCAPFVFANFCALDGNFRNEFEGWLRQAWGVDTSEVISQISGGYLARDKTFSWIKEQLESSPPGVEAIFCKESGGLDGHLEYLPKGFRHTFLIRHPYKVFRSWKKMINDGMTDISKQIKITEQPQHVLPDGYHFKELYDMYHYVKTNIDPHPLVLDIDDLHRRPGTFLKAYCQAVGIPYSDSLLQWESGRDCMDKRWMISKEQIATHNHGGYNRNTFASTCFQSPGPLPERSELDEDVLYCSDACMGYYQEMYENRLKC